VQTIEQSTIGIFVKYYINWEGLLGTRQQGQLTYNGCGTTCETIKKK